MTVVVSGSSKKRAKSGLVEGRDAADHDTVTAAAETSADGEGSKKRSTGKKRRRQLGLGEEAAAGCVEGAPPIDNEHEGVDMVGTATSTGATTTTAGERKRHKRLKKEKGQRGASSVLTTVADGSSVSPPFTCTSKAAEYTAEANTSGTGDGSMSNKKKKKKKRKKDAGPKSAHDTSATTMVAARPANGNTNSDTDMGQTSLDSNTDADNLEGIMHDGAMFLVDSQRRVFSVERDEQGELMQVGTFDRGRGGMVEMELSTTVTGSAAAAGDALAAHASAIETPTPSPNNSVAAAPHGSGAPERCTGASSSGGTGTEADPKDEKRKTKKKKNNKKKKNRSGDSMVGGGSDAGGKTTEAAKDVAAKRAEDVVDYPFEVEECDHCETSERAYADIVPLLTAIAKELGKASEELAIYDPYYCQGSTVGRLASFGFPRVHNRKEDFYEVVKNGRIPEHDVVVTNPPFSGDHVAKILRFCSRREGKPWFLLLPNFIYLKDYFEPSLNHGSGGGPTLPFYLTPPKRYMYYSPQGSRLAVKSSERKTSPFNTFWYIRVGDGAITSKILQSFDAVSRKSASESRCCVARTPQQIPYKMMDSNDPRRKKARDRQRSIDRIRKKKSEWVVS